ncbi:ComEC/Rec2 family competence protein [Sulfitobacter sp. F26204]|uniref:ComEC/Rec2 family competence protein n=1 Tax=Sulfitobacter sp. F26204 TaxID=2996014 RepID=UPI00225E62FA|nr:ComEC/Rec2 family competence protein [Sulfitobacter sp. F26204]MCX7559500.1 ComEC/Rec2 family competence protein [Sulfitobacter sp. F26204]
MGRISRILQLPWRRIQEVLLAQRGHLLGWVPVCLGAGIGFYFSLRTEPAWPVYVWFGLGAVLLFVLAWHLGEAISPIAVAGAVFLTGFLLAGGRAHSVAAPTLAWRYYGAVEGRIVAIDRSQSDAVRLTLDQVRLDRIAPARTPLRVRISLHYKGPAGITPAPGLRVMTTAHLSPPSGPVEPSGFDFQRHAWFNRLGAVGYARVPLMGVAPASEGHAGLRVFRIRMAASSRIQEHLAGDTGGFAAAITTGDRSAMSRPALDALRASNLAHLLAISGLHMGLLTAFVFAVLRSLLAMHPVTALHLPTKGIAAFGALAAAACYLALSGGNVATQRAFIMIAVALAALIIGRRAMTIRAVSVAATIVLTLRPEALLGPGFQMSFAATTALVAVFEWLRGINRDGMAQWVKPVFATVVSSAVAGVATAPIAAAHFNAIAHYGLIANLLSVPLMGVLVIPAAVVGLLLAPLGLEWIGLWVMGLGLDWILKVAHTIAGLENARGYVVGPGGWVVPLLALGFLTIILWQGRLRWAGGALMAVGFVLWHGTERPDVLIADNGALVGVMTPQGRALSKSKTAGFVARNWLENDGVGPDQIAAAKMWKQGAVVHLSGKRALAGFRGCTAEQIVVTSVKAGEIPDLPCMFFDPLRLRHSGSIALRRIETAWQITTARDLAGERLWTRWPKAGKDDQ